MQAWVEIFVAGKIGALPRLYFEAPPGFKYENMEALGHGIASAFRSAGLVVDVKAVLDNRRVPAVGLPTPPQAPFIVQLDVRCGEALARLAEASGRIAQHLESRERDRVRTRGRRKS